MVIHVTLALTDLNTSKSSISDVSLGFSSRSGFLSISKLNMCKANLFSLASRAGGNWIHAMLKPLVGEKGGVVQHLFFLNGFIYFSLPSIFSLSWSNPITFLPANSHVL